MKALALAGAAEGSWLRAERQTGGRGRSGRSWASPPGNLYASTLVRLRPGDPPAPTLALVAGDDVDWGPVGVKTAVTLFLVLLLARNRRFLSVPRGLWLLMGLLTLLNAALSVLWR